MPRPLKVFRTPIGFHDAYVAASSQKAALAAWGADADLFARGMAEAVTDPALTRAPLARPGEVIRVARGSSDEHFAALAKSATTTKRNTSPKRAPQPKPSAPRPSRAKLNAADNALTEAQADLEAADRALSAREAALHAERRKFDADRSSRVRRLTAARDDAAEDYRRALADWEP